MLTTQISPDLDTPADLLSIAIASETVQNPGTKLFADKPRLVPAKSLKRPRGALSVVIPAFGVATICNLFTLGSIVSPNHVTIYHLSGPVSALIIPVLCNLLFITILLASILALAMCTPRTEAAAWIILLGAMPWVILRNVSPLYGFLLPHALNLGTFTTCFVAIVAFCWHWRPFRNPLYTHVRRIGSSALGYIALLGLILVLQTLWMGWQARHLNDVSSITPPPAQPFAAHRPLVLWIVFDELSYDQVYGSRYPGLELPSLDRFARESTVFTHVVPAGDRTEAILPSLITGVPDNRIRSSSDGQHLYLHVPADPVAAAHWQPFNPAQTVFAEARSIGYHPAIVGWFNPYCRLLSSELSSCSWTDTANRLFPGDTIANKLFGPIVRLLQRTPSFFFRHHFYSNDPVKSQLHIDDYKQLYSAADKTLADPSLDFVFLHMPIPHPFGIYDRRHAVLTTGPSTYIDNLALVDKYLAHLRQTLQQRHEWDDATVLIMGDHSWRTQLLWMSSPEWSAEEQRASHGGKFDDRPFFALKLPHQQTPASISSTVHALDTRALLDALLHHQIRSPQQLNAWALQAR
ncbi:MAG: sulfatase-like hydrolase/transferase [Acidobacteriaceae bacterium]